MDFLTAPFMITPASVNVTKNSIEAGSAVSNYVADALTPEIQVGSGQLANKSMFLRILAATIVLTITDALAGPQAMILMLIVILFVVYKDAHGKGLR